MKVSTEIKVVGGVIGMLLVLLAFLLYEATGEMRINNDLLDQNNEIERGDSIDALRQEYDRLVLECVEPPVVQSQERFVRDLCDVTLPTIREELYGVGR